jgi:membrane-bound lytic murein transglycosylase D
LFTSNEDKIYAYAAHEESLREKPGSQLAYRKSSSDSLYSDGTRTVKRTKYHKVRRGDNLSEIANRYDVSIAQIKKWNKLKSNKVALGRSLKIYTTETIAYKVKKKETKPAVEKSTAVASVDLKAAKEATKKLATSTTSADNSNNVADNDSAPEYYTVEAGDNLYGIAKKFNVSVKDIKQWNNFDDDNLLMGTRIKILNNTEAENAVAEKEVKTIEYTVKKGDFLGIIAKKNHVAIEDLREWNNLDDNNVHVGQKLIVGKVEVTEAVAAKSKDKVTKKAANDHYYVKPGDSLFSIAKKYPGITVSDIKRWNGIKNENIKPGMKLKINNG